ncbi:unnamed protein product [Mytilus edulis]|uniref:YqaJ viral recombinase domain-containing protein n=1 Tax=Mytilus edulis TaxID=6550 RepID=A0A8S3TR84_MYTED|nr:unnamed protein product [Mytilus edulis]
MGSKYKKGRIFGRGLGRHRRFKRVKHLGRPVYEIKRQRNQRKHILKLKIRKINKQFNNKSLFRNKEVYTTFSTGCDLKLKIRKVKNNLPIAKGYRVMNLDCLQAHISDITLHACLCAGAINLAKEGKAPIKLETEVRSLGLATVMLAKCMGCLQKFKLETSPKVPGSKRYDINVRAVWGSMVTGNGPAHLNEFLATLNSPGLSQPSFSAIETDIGNWWHSVLDKEMMIAGQEERRLAIERKDFHEEIPAITVIADGGWSKRTHKHSYNAAGGVAIIIGKETKKLLHIGVRNKYCYICNKNDSTPHTCFKNWDQDSQSMEGDIILEGFREAEKKHGLRYMRLVGDGDSSVFARIREEVPGWGRSVSKEECANHLCKCYRSNLEKLVTDNPLYKGKHHLTKNTRVRLVSALRCAIRVRSRDLKDKKTDKFNAIRKLKHDVKNSVHHVFGNHSQCSDFCRAKNQPLQTSNEDNTPLQISTKTSDSGIADEEQLIDQQIDYWSEGASISAQEQARFGTTIAYSNVEQHIIKDVTNLLCRIAEKSDRLINNSTTNLAESWMHIRTKFDGGKVHNLCNRGSWHARCYGGALRMNLGPQWSCKVWESSIGTEPGHLFRKLYARHEQTLANSIKHKSKPNIQQVRWKKKMSCLKTSTSKKARKAYGPEAIDVTDDVSSDNLEKLKHDYLNLHIHLSELQRLNITNLTILQSQSGLWHTERKKRITASDFGSIVKRNPSLLTAKFIRTILYSTFTGNYHTRKGILEEETTIEEYKLKKAEESENVCVERSGLVIHPTQTFLAGSPDGLVSTSKGESGLIEIKNLLHSKPINLWEASENKNFCLINLNGKLQLKENHIYYYQCHGLINIYNRDWIDFVVRTLNPHQLFIQRIYRNIDFWENTMLPKLEAFYHKVLLPELASPREGKSPGIREPGIWYTPPLQSKQPRRKRSKSSTVNARSKKRVSESSSSSDSDIVDTELQRPAPLRNRRTRLRPTKFLGRSIKHEWIIDEFDN